MSLDYKCPTNLRTSVLLLGVVQIIHPIEYYCDDVRINTMVDLQMPLDYKSKDIH